MKICVIALLLFALPSCARDRYRRAANRDSYNILLEKSSQRPWYLPGSYSVNAAPRSRLFDPSNPNDPMLPDPGPHLYSYELPQLSERLDAAAEPIESPQGLEPDDENSGLLDDQIRLASAKADVDASSQKVMEIENAAADTSHDARLESLAIFVSRHRPAGTKIRMQTQSGPKPYEDAEEGLTIQPIPRAYWDALPQVCLSRMLEFESVREEYRRTFETDPPKSLRDPSPKLTFDDIVELAYLNSREYQTQKETLYSSALALTAERYRYMTKFSVAGNGADVNYGSFRSGGTEVNTLNIPSEFSADKTVALGGTLVTQFANNVLLTFNGPQGFASDVNSILLFDFTQSVFQRDILLQPLIQSERNVVYAARTFTRFRKQFFFNLAQTYYTDLLSTYRGIEINTQNYFAFVRALDQAEAEVRSGVGDAPPRVQIDQIEQNMLGGRSSLISICNSLETSLDQLKLTLGLPTETPINIDLRELETLTGRDEIEVAGELIRRARERVDTQLSSEVLDREEILSAAIVLLDRILDWLQVRERIVRVEAGDEDLRVLRARLRVDEAYEAVTRTEKQLEETKKSVPPPLKISIFQRTMDTVQTRLDVVARQLLLADELKISTEERDAVLKKFVELKERNDAVLDRVLKFLGGDEDDDLDALLDEAEAILLELEDLDADARRMVGAPAERPDAETETKQTLDQMRELLEKTDQLGAEAKAVGLTPVDLHVDDAMVTALVQRLELMNERGSLADDWRLIKLAADDLKSVLNLNVAQSFQTQQNQPFAFNFEDSQTQLSAALDLPLNRRQQRNNFRQALINYQVGRRSLMALEDNIKFAARQDLRTLNLDRVQYDIAVVSSALASERVYSTQLELALGLATVTARDFLEAQQAYRSSLTNVANGRLGYIVDRAQLALDLELMMLDDAGFWPDIKNGDYQPKTDPIYPLNAGPTYGELPRAVWPSKRIKRQLHYPLPGYQVIGVSPPERDAATPEELPVPVE